MGGLIREQRGAVTAGGAVVPFVSFWRGDGPTAVVTGGVHGDELTGVLAVHLLQRWFSERLPLGRVVLFPCVNPIGLAARTRTMGVSGPDLNRLFPGDPDGDGADLLVRGVFDAVVALRPDVVVDVHADSTRSIPYAILDRPVLHDAPRRASLAARIRAFAEASGLTALDDYPDVQYRRFSLDRTLAGAMVNRAGIPAITVEAGPRRVVDDAAVACAEAAVRGVASALRLCDPVAPHPTRVPGAWRRSTHLRAEVSGVLVPAIEAGVRFSRGQHVATLVDLDGVALTPIAADVDGFVAAWVDGGWVTAGQSVATLGVPEEVG